MISEQCSISWYTLKNHAKCILEDEVFLGIHPTLRIRIVPFLPLDAFQRPSNASFLSLIQLFLDFHLPTLLISVLS